MGHSCGSRAAARRFAGAGWGRSWLAPTIAPALGGSTLAVPRPPASRRPAPALRAAPPAHMDSINTCIVPGGRWSSQGPCHPAIPWYPLVPSPERGHSFQAPRPAPEPYLLRQRTLLSIALPAYRSAARSPSPPLPTAAQPGLSPAPTASVTMQRSALVLLGVALLAVGAAAQPKCTPKCSANGVCSAVSGPPSAAREMERVFESQSGRRGPAYSCCTPWAAG